MNLESRGIPSVGIATTAFVDAAASQSESLGLNASIMFVDHPIQDRTDKEIRDLADQAVAEVVERLTTNGSPAIILEEVSGGRSTDYQAAPD